MMFIFFRIIMEMRGVVVILFYYYQKRSPNFIITFIRCSMLPQWIANVKNELYVMVIIIINKGKNLSLSNATID